MVRVIMIAALLGATTLLGGTLRETSDKIAAKLSAQEPRRFVDWRAADAR